MIILNWNYRGLWKQHVIDVLSQLAGEKSPNVLFHMETKQSINEMRWVQVRLPYRCMLAVPSIRRSGGLALLWMEEIDLHIQTFTLNHIDVLILSDPNTPWDRLPSTIGRKSKESTSHGNCYGTFTLDTQFLGYVLTTSTKFWHLKRNKWDYQNPWISCRHFSLPYFTVGWWT